VLAVVSIKLEFATQPPGVTWMVPLLVLALPLSDICLVVFTRLREGRSPAQAGKDHTSHRLMSIGLSQKQTIWVLYGFCILFGVLGLVAGLSEPPVAWTVGISGLLVLAVWLTAMVIIRARYQSVTTTQTKSN
jgi:UDP-GlcNAc:undecaprenyl-phosphate GlcNAc-1-phosphate transferase